MPRLRISRAVLLVLAAGVSLFACTSPQGGEREACYPNGTCNAGLTCLSNVCVAVPDGGSDAAADTTPADVVQPPDGTLDAGSDSPADSALDTIDDAATDSASDGATDGSACTPPTSLEPPPAGPASLYCPFAAPDGGSPVYCMPTTQHCCEASASSTTPTACEQVSTACATGTLVDWQCADPVADCNSDPARPICCAPGASIVLGTAGCANFARRFYNTTCVAPGNCTGIIMCTSNAECPFGMTCVPFTRGDNAVGGCM